MLQKTNPGGADAIVRYEDAEFTVLREGRQVRCAVTGEAILLEHLRYWNVDRQEAYRDVHVAIARWRELHGRG